MTIAIYPGSFDPITFGHLDIIERSSQIFKDVYVGVMINPKKKYTFDMQERISLIAENVAKLKNVHVVGFDGLLVDFMNKNNINVIVKGLRTVTDYEYEFQMALLNKRINHKVETLFLPTSEKYSLISSSMVKELFTFGGDVTDFVPENVRLALNNSHQ